MKVLVLGLDVFSSQLMLRWARSGALPTLGSLLANGASGPLAPTGDENDVAAWSSLVTGLDPGKHGVFGPTEIVPGTYRVRVTDVSSRQGEPVWEILHNLGHSCGVVSVPLTRPMETPGIFVIPGANASAHTQAPRLFGLGHGAWASDRNSCSHSAIERLARRGLWDEAANAAVDCVEARGELVLGSIGRSPPDFLMAALPSADVERLCILGNLAHHDPRERVKRNHELHSLIQKTYCRIDDIVAQFIEKASPEIIFVVVRQAAALGELEHQRLIGCLSANGFLYTHPWRTRLRGAFAGLRKSVRAAGHRHAWLEQSASSVASIDWLKTQAYCLSGSSVAINLEGREPGGVVPQSRYEALCRQIIGRLLKLRDPVTSIPLVESAQMRGEVFSGPLVDRAPDILVRWSMDYQMMGLEALESYSQYEQDDSMMLQDWRQRGLFLAAGSGIAPGEVRARRIVDIAPTILAIYGANAPEEMDGNVLTGLFASERHAVHPIVAVTKTATHVNTSAESSAQENLFAERLHGLGYID